MSLWLLIILLGLLKLPIAGLMLWIPYRNDRAMNAAASAAATDADEPDASEDDGGSMALPASPLDPHPQSPRPHPRRRGPHGSRSRSCIPAAGAQTGGRRRRAHQDRPRARAAVLLLRS